MNQSPDSAPVPAPPGGPYLQSAFFCEKALKEESGVFSYIRVVDRVTHTVTGPNAPQNMPAVTLPLTLVITVKSGRARGRQMVTIRRESPAGLREQPISMPVFLEGEDRGVGIVMETNLTYEEEGLYWFDVELDGRLVTRMPLRLLYHRVSVG